jgi:hypothetical protein
MTFFSVSEDIGDGVFWKRGTAVIAPFSPLMVVVATVLTFSFERVKKLHYHFLSEDHDRFC